MRFSGRPIRGALAVTVFLLTGTVGGVCSQHGVPPHALHEKKHDAKKQVEALEDVWRTAQLSSDVATMDKLLSDDYIGISMTGQVYTKAQQLDRMRDHKFALTKLELGEMQVKLVGAIAIVTSRAEVVGTNDGSPVMGTYRYTRVYQRLPTGEWKITSFEATRVPGPRGAVNTKRDGEAAKVQQPVTAPN